MEQKERTQWKPLDYARAACDTMMRKFKPEDLPPKGHFHYHQGVFRQGYTRPMYSVKRKNTTST